MIAPHLHDHYPSALLRVRNFIQDVLWEDALSKKETDVLKAILRVLEEQALEVIYGAEARK